MVSGVLVSDVLAGGKVLAGDGLILRDLQALRCPPMGDVHQSQLRSMVGGEQWRRPRRGVVVPGEGLANMGRHGAHEHQGSVGMLSPNSIWTELGRRGVIDGGLELGFSPAAMLACVLQARATEGGEGVAGSLQEDDVVLVVPLIGAGRPFIGGSTGGRAAAALEAHRHCGKGC
jgi:hypothetical protein